MTRRSGPRRLCRVQGLTTSGHVSQTGEESQPRISTGDIHDATATNPDTGSAAAEPVTRTSEVRLSRHSTCIGTWNVRTLMDTGKLHLLIEELQRNKLRITGISETRWSNKGHFPTINGHTVYFSGATRTGQKGVAIILDNKMSKAVLGYNPVNERMMSVRINSKPNPISVLQVYAPTSAAADIEHEDFYSDLQSLIDSIPKKDVLIIQGDFNAKVGSTCLDSEVMADEGLGEVNDSGHRLIDFCKQNALVIANTLFQQHARRKYTWTSPDGLVRNQIDYILTQKRWKSNLLNCKTYPGADCSSDHELLKAKVRLRLRKMQPQPAPLRYDLREIPAEYTVATSNSFAALLEIDDEHVTPDELWAKMKEAIDDAAEKHIPKKQRVKRSSWIRDDTIQLAKRKREIKISSGTHSSEYAEAKRTLRRACRSDKNEYYNNLCSNLEEEARQGNSRGMFQAVRTITKKFSPRMGSIKDKHGKVLTEQTEIKERWREYVEELFKKPIASDIPQDSSASNEIQELEPIPLVQEVSEALNRIKKGKSPGADNIPIELLQAAGIQTVPLLHKLICRIWKEGTWPTDWCKAIYIPLPKKGDLQRCENYRTIALISHTSKVMLNIILNRIRTQMQIEISPEQAGFQPGRGTKDQIFNLRILMEKARTHNLELHMCFIDYKKAFDCVEYDSLWKIMTKLNFPKHIVCLLKHLYDEQLSAVRTSSGETDWFRNGRGVRQGCVLSPNLFNIDTEYIIREALNEDDGVSIGGRKIANLRYADDTVLIAPSDAELQDILNRVADISAKYGLMLNANKTKTMMAGKELKRIEIYAGDELLEQVEQFTYLGAAIAEDASSEADIRTRIAIARSTMIKYTTLWKDRNIKLNTKARLMKTLIWSIFTYGCETWTLKAADEKRIAAFEMWCIRRMLRVSWVDRKTNEWCLNKASMTRQLLVTVKLRKLKFFGHIVRHSSLEKTIMEGQMEGRRSRGRQRLQWIDNIRMWLQAPVSECRRLALERRQWRMVIHARIGIG